MMTETKRTRRVARGMGLVLAGAVGATALTGLAFADDTSAPTQTQQGMQMHGGQGGPERGMRGPGGPVLHGQATIERDGAFIETAQQTGTIDSVGADNIRVTSADGFSATYAVTDQTEIRLDRSSAAIGDLSAGLTVRIHAEQGDNGLTAVHIGALTEEGKSEMEQRRAEREDQRADREQRRAERQGPSEDA